MTDFLLVNGWALRVADGAFRRAEDLPATVQRAIDGSLLSHASAVRRVIEGRVPILDPYTDAAVAGLLSGRGHTWHFNPDASGDGYAVDKYSSRGLYPQGTPASDGRPSTGADGLTSTDSYTISNDVVVPKLGTGCLLTGPAATNRLAANVADASSAAGFTARGAGSSVAYSTTTKWRGAGSVLVTVTTAAARGVECQYASGVASTQYVAAVYLLAASGTPQVDVWVRDETGATDGTKVRVTLSTTVWRRVEAAVTCTAAGGAHTVKVIVESAGTTGDDFYIDELLLVASTTPHAGAWVAGTATRTATSLVYPLTDLRPGDDFTFMAWMRTGALANGLFGLGQMAFSVGDSKTNCVSLGAQLGDDAVTSQVNGVAGAHEDAGQYFADAAGQWTHVAVVVRRVAGSITVYRDGVAGGAAATGSLPSFTAPLLAVGSDLAGGNIFEGQLDEVVLVPWAMSAEQIAAWYAREFSDLPSLDVSGAAVAGTSVEVEMQPDGSAWAEEYVQAASGGAWSPLHRTVPFRLREV